MPDILQIGATIDLSQVIPGLNTLTSQVQRSTEQMNASFTQLRSGLILTSGGVHELEAAGVTLDRAIRPGIDALTPAMSRASASTQGARMAMRGLGEETGVHMPRFVSSFLGSVGPVAGIMAAAFAPIAIIGLIGVFVDAISKIGEMTDSMMGFDAAAKKAYEDATQGNLRLLTGNIELHSKQRDIAETGITGSAKQALAVKDVGDTTKETASLMAGLMAAQVADQARLEFVTLHWNHLGLAVRRVLGVTGENTAAMEAEIPALKKGIENRAALLDKLTEEQRLRTQIGAPKAAAELKVTTSGEALALDKARTEAAHLVAETQFAIRRAEIQREAAEGRIGAEEELAQLRLLTAQKLAIDAKYYADRKALAEKEAALTRKPAGPETVALAAKATIDALSTNAALAASSDEIAERQRKRGEELAIEKITAAEEVADATIKLEENTNNQLLAQGRITVEQYAANVKMITEEGIIAKTAELQGELAIAQAGGEREAVHAKEIQDRINAYYIEAGLIRAKAGEDGDNAIIREDERLFERTTMLADRALRLDEITDAGRLRTHEISRRQWATAEESAIDKWYAAQKAALEKELNDEKRIDGERSDAYLRTQMKMDALDKEHDAKITAIHNKEELSFAQMMDQMSKQMSQSLAQMLTGHESFASAMGRIEEEILSKVISVEAEKLEIKIASAIKARAIDAGQAAANAMKDYPFPVNVAVAAAVFAETMAIGSFDEGGLATKTGLAMIHQSEIVMPASVSHAITMIGSGGPRQVQQRNEIHLHHNGPDARQVLDRELRPRIERMMRRGEIAVP